ncbi:hypothetical protein V0R50_13360 [Pseudomonas sp. 148P]|uniref:Uncharacterized protein n=1 Tax=Pseudomonas ulcerans TaxID=3115852 RepID=A0ABU7HRP9_9PSED|nr:MULTISPECIES: hypothetical protein [unclassified Pseudomonas]MEE1922125.1 hypothetical protein [Pseudomonas sp. 147P]MEE1934215.1 hypothetical protein [Pseudomonas sp. 148P]
MTSQKPARHTQLRESAMLAKGKTRILHSGDWLTAQRVVELAPLNSEFRCSLVAEWWRAGKIFALHHEGIDYFPIYAFDPAADYQPRPGLAPVITTLASKKDGWGMAFWFGSSNSVLGGRMPKDCG